jgi:hypothetical protein
MQASGLRRNWWNWLSRGWNSVKPAGQVRSNEKGPSAEADRPFSPQEYQCCLSVAAAAVRAATTTAMESATTAAVESATAAMEPAATAAGESRRRSGDQRQPEHSRQNPFHDRTLLVSDERPECSVPG